MEHDSAGNVICPDCQAHVRPDLFQMHDCPPWLKLLVKKRKEVEALPTEDNK